ncbi:MAG: EamA family transporter, partial [Clostridium sp.]|nr:EamA family transporter [Clostridium sp.]
MRKYMSEIALMITALIWGSGFVASAISLEYYTPYQILAGRFLVGAVILTLVFMKRIKQIKKSTLKRGII